MKNILHIVNGSVNSNNGYAQRIKRQLELWSQIENINVSVVNFLDWRKLLSSRILSDVKKSRLFISRLNFNYFTRFGLPLIAFFYNPEIYFNLCAISLKRIIKKEKIKLVYAENLIGGYMANIIKNRYNVDYIIDYHGVAPEEFIQVGKSFRRINYEYYKKMEKVTLQEAKGIVCVSNKFKRYIVENFNISEDKVFVIPSCIPSKYINFNIDKRLEIRKKLKLLDKKVIIYAGGIGLWHCDEEMISLFKKMSDYDKSFYFIFLTHSDNKEIISKKMKDFGVDNENYIIDSVSHNEIYYYYMASDIGIIIRDDSLVNRISSPTKIAEYLSTGMTLLSTNNIGDIMNIPSNKVVLEYQDIKNNNIDIHEIYRKLDRMQKREENYNVCKNYLQTHLVWEQMIPIYEKLFFN